MVKVNGRFSSASDEWYTPHWLVEYLAAFLGVSFDLDPCVGPGAPSHAPFSYGPDQDGLAMPWFGDVFCNPPYSKKGCMIWGWKGVEELSAKRANTVTLLVPARLDTQWYHALAQLTQHQFVPLGRIPFARPNGTRPGNPAPSIVLFLTQSSVRNRIFPAVSLREIKKQWENNSANLPLCRPWLQNNRNC